MVSHKFYKKWDILLVNLDPTRGKEISKVRPCLVVSPNVMNKHLQTIIIVPLPTSEKNYPTRLPTKFRNKPGELCFDHIKSIDRTRVIQKEGVLEINIRKQVNDLLREMFSEE